MQLTATTTVKLFFPIWTIHLDIEQESCGFATNPINFRRFDSFQKTTKNLFNFIIFRGRDNFEEHAEPRKKNRRGPCRFCKQFLVVLSCILLR